MRLCPTNTIGVQSVKNSEGPEPLDTFCRIEIVARGFNRVSVPKYLLASELLVPGVGTRVALVGGVSHLITKLALFGLSVMPFGCYATAGAYAEADYVETTYEPAHVEVYPHYVYAGRTVYLVNDRWYYRRGPHWVYYRTEPQELHRRRVYVQRAPRPPVRHEARRDNRDHHDKRDHHDRDRD